MEELNRLFQIVGQLRAENGCPWDRAQDFATMRPYLLEEVYETLAAMDLPAGPQRNQALEEELGDLSFVLLLLCRIGAEEGIFNQASVFKRISDKMIMRHPHVFGEGHDRPSTDEKGSITTWEDQKARINPERSRLDGVPKTLPGLLRAHRQGEKAAAVGFDWPDHTGVWEKVQEEMGELSAAMAAQDAAAIQHELGDVFLSLSSLGRHLGAPPESAMREANERFAHRFRIMEEMARETSTPLGTLQPKEWENLWVRAKKVCDLLD